MERFPLLNISGAREIPINVHQTERVHISWRLDGFVTVSYVRTPIGHKSNAYVIPHRNPNRWINDVKCTRLIRYRRNTVIKF